MKTDAFKYSINIFWSNEDNSYIATIPEMEGLSAFGDTPEEALKEARQAAKGFIEVMDKPDLSGLIGYRQRQFARLKGAKGHPKIAIFWDERETNWLNISVEELEEIKAVLTKKRDDEDCQGGELLLSNEFMRLLVDVSDKGKVFEIKAILQDLKKANQYMASNKDVSLIDTALNKPDNSTFFILANNTPYHKKLK